MFVKSYGYSHLSLSLDVQVYVTHSGPQGSVILFVLLCLCRAIDILNGASPSTDHSNVKIALSILIFYTWIQISDIIYVLFM